MRIISLHLEWINSTCRDVFFLLAPPVFSACPYQAHHVLLCDILPNMESIVKHSTCCPNLNSLLLSFERRHSIPFRPSTTTAAPSIKTSAPIRRRRKRRRGQDNSRRGGTGGQESGSGQLEGDHGCIYVGVVVLAGPFLPPSLQKSDAVRSQVELLSSPLRSMSDGADGAMFNIRVSWKTSG